MTKIFAFIFVLFSSLSSFGSCNFLLHPESQIKSESIEAEANLSALRKSATKVIQRHLLSPNLNMDIKDQNGDSLIEKMDLKALKFLVYLQSQSASDYLHFGAPIQFSTNPPAIDKLQELTQQVSPELNPESVFELSLRLAVEILIENQEQLVSTIRHQQKTFSKTLAADKEMSLNTTLNEDEYREMKSLQATFREINNYMARLIYQADGGHANIGFVPADNTPNPSKKNKIGFIHNH